MPASYHSSQLLSHTNAAPRRSRTIEVRSGSWLRKNVSEGSKAASDWLASTLKRADWLFLRLRGLETLLKLPEVILSDLETPRQPAAQARIAARSGFTPTMFITRVRL
jgi:hypothetical protein